ncbi:MAG: ATP-binding protein [Fimbriimonadaceae bacterium]
MAAQPQWSQADLWDLFDLSPVSDTDIQKYLDITLSKCVSWFRASGGSIFLEDFGGEFSLRAKYGEQKRLPCDAQIVRGRGIAGIVALSGVARLIDDPSVHPDMVGVAENRLIASSMVLPLLDSRRKVIGVLNISRQAGEPAFRIEDLNQAEAVSAHVSLAVGNAELVNRLKSSLDATAIANEQLVAVLDSVGASVWVVDAEGLVVNENFSAAEARADKGAARLAESFPGLVDSALGSGRDFRERVYDSASDRTWLVRATPLESGGAVVAAQEISEHEQQQRELGRVRRLAEIGQMTAAIAHEIRNPLTGIRSAAQMIREDHEMVGDFIGLIEEEVLKLNALCDEFLEFARPMQLSLGESSLVSTVEGIVSILQPLAQENGLNLQVLIESGDGNFEFDDRKIGQVLHNLVRNALEVSTSGGEVRITVWGRGFSVSDDGPGMDEETLERLFSPFFTTKAHGTGLGLCTSKKIIDAHGGVLNVESTSRGTTFTVQLDRDHL